MTHFWPHHDADELCAVTDVLRSGRTNYWSGEHGHAFEREFAAYTGAKHALTVSNGTTALEVALHALMYYTPVGEWIVPCRTFMATASAVVTAGCKPVLADIDPVTLNVTVETLDARRGPWTRGVIVVHFGGLPCDMPAIMDWAIKHNILVIEDCAHAHGARINGRHVGTFGDIGCFSFCVGKIISTGGEGGMVITNNDELHRRMGARRDHGRYQMVGSKDMTNFQWTVEEFGTNARLTEMQSVIGRLQLKKLDTRNARRHEIAARYDKELGWTVLRAEGAVKRHGLYLYVGRVENRDRVLAQVPDARIGGCPNIGREKIFGGMAPPCPVADAVGEKTLALPVYPTMTNGDVGAVIADVKKALAS